MQLTNFIAILAITVTGAVAVPSPNGRISAPVPVAPPPKPVKPVKPVNVQPVISNQVNYCSSGSPYCCSPSDGKGTTCQISTTQCNAVAICCNNVQGGNAPSTQTCSSSNSLQQPITFVLDSGNTDGSSPQE